MSIGGGEMIWHSLRSLPVAIAGALVLASLVLWFYPAQVRFISRPWRWMLPALRIIALVALMIALLKPVAIRARPAEQQDAVVVLIDQSKSMSVGDASARTSAQLVALADAMGMLNGDVRPDPVAGVEQTISELRTRADELARQRGRLDIAKLTASDVHSAQQLTDEAIARFRASLSSLLLRGQSFPKESAVAMSIAGLSGISDAEPGSEAWVGQVRAHADRVETSLVELRAAADAELYNANPQVKAACDQLANLSRIELAARALAGSGNGLLGRLNESFPVATFTFAGEATALPFDGNAALAPITADGTSSDIAGAIRSAGEQLRGRGVQAFVILSDGRGTTSGGSAVQLPFVEAPVYAIGVAPREPGKDIAIARVTMPQRQFVGETMTLRVDVRHRGFAGAAIDVAVTGEGIDQTQRVTLPEDPTIPLEFAIKLDHPPAQKIAIAVAEVAGEITAENNRVERWVKVNAEKLDIAAYSGSPAWDFQYLRNTLSRTPWATLDEAILPNEAVKPALTPQQILAKDVIILHDLAAASFSGEQWRAIHQFVTERGGSLILIAGDAHLPAEYAQNETLASLLPYRGGLKPVWRIWSGQTPSFQLIPAPGTEAIDALRLSDDPAEGRQRWNVLPGWFRYLSIAELKSNATPLLIERDSRAPVLTEARLGLGRVFFFGGNETWRWRYKVGEALQDRFWLQLIRHAAGEPYSASAGGVSIDVDPVSIMPAQSVRIRARIRELSGDMPSTQSTMPAVTILGGGESARRQALAPVGPEGAGTYEAMVSNLGAGEYQVQLDAGGSVLELALHVTANVEDEMRDVAGDEQNLRRIAQGSGGEFIPLERAHDLPDLLESRRVEKTIVAEYPLWDSPYLFVFVVACLGTEWALRKAVGLA